MTETLLDGTSIAAGESATADQQLNDGRRGFDWTYFIAGDGGSTDVTIEWQLKPHGSAQFYPLDGGSKANVDLTAGDNNAKAYEVDIGAVEEVRLKVTNNTTGAITVSAEADTSFQ